MGDFEPPIIAFCNQCGDFRRSRKKASSDRSALAADAFAGRTAAELNEKTLRRGTV